MSGSLFHSEKLGRSPQYFWYGMVVGGSEWEDNQKDEAISQHKIHERDDVAGWGHRCKVAIMGYDPKIVDDKAAKNSELVMAEVMVPTTGGGGVGGPVMTPTLGNNSFVIGFFKDGVNAREPVIMGVLPNVSQSRMKPYDTPETSRYDASTGYRPGEDPVANDAIWPDGDKMETGEMVRPITVMLQAQKEDGDRLFGIPSIEKCSGSSGSLSSIQGTMQQMMNGINSVRSGGSSIMSGASDALKSIPAIMATASNLIAANMRDIISTMRGFVLNTVNKATQFVLDLLPPNLVGPTLDSGVNPAMDFLSCTFNTIMGNAKGIVGNFLTNIIGGSVNSFFSTAGALVGDFLTNTLGTITSAIDGALSSIGGAVDGILGAITDPLGTVFGFLKMLSCESDQACPAITEWNFLYGNGKSTSAAAAPGADVGTVFDPSSSPESGAVTEGAFPVLSGPPLITTVGGGQEQSTTTTNFSPTQQSNTQQVGQQADAEGQAFAAQEREISRTGSSQSSYDLGDGASFELY